MATGQQVGITRLPARRLTNEPRESMNCKSCRKRKIKCNRLRPTCEACQVFACPCIYDAVPKKRGPKTDVLEALLKRVDGLEKRLHHEKSTDSDQPRETVLPDAPETTSGNAATQASSRVEIPPPGDTVPMLSPAEQSPPTSISGPEILLDTYFQRIHGKPYYILDEASTRHRMQSNQLPPPLALAIYAVSARYAPNMGGYINATQLSQEYARRARMDIDVDEPSIEALQTFLLLTQASHQAGKGKKTYMLLCSAISMAFALSLHRELSPNIKISPAGREARRRLFWACYLMDRFSACGSKRPSLISDEAVLLRMPEGDHFPCGSNIQYLASAGRLNQGGTGMLIGIVRVLGITNRYLAAGGVKGDSHFPWHSLSNLSKIRQELDLWASDTQETFSSLEALFGQSDSTVIVLSKLIYHLIHCLVYRPFLPVDLAELSGSSQHQSWQIEATNLCFLHANAIAELVEIGRASSILDWPAFVAYCVCTAGTIHVHGAHYQGREGEVFSASAEFLSRELNQLTELRYAWASTQHQRDTLQTIYGCHSELVKSLASNPMRFSPVFQLEDFFDRYPGQNFDGAHVTFLEVMVDAIPESHSYLPYGIDQRVNSYFSPSVQYAPEFNHVMTPTIQDARTNPFATMPSHHHHQHHESSQAPQVQPRRKRTLPSSNHRPSEFSGQQTSEGKMLDMLQSSTSQRPTNAHLALSTDLPTGFTPPSFSPTFHFTPMASHATLASHTHEPSTQHALLSDPNGSEGASIGTSTMFELNDNAIPNYDQHEQQATPGAISASGSTHTDPEKDPFLSLLEQLAENDGGRGGPSDLDFFLGQNVGHGQPGEEDME